MYFVEQLFFFFKRTRLKEYLLGAKLINKNKKQNKYNREFNDTQTKPGEYRNRNGFIVER